jgi:hypothetical protein
MIVWDNQGVIVRGRNLCLWCWLGRSCLLLRGTTRQQNAAKSKCERMMLDSGGCCHHLDFPASLTKSSQKSGFSKFRRPASMAAGDDADCVQ